MACYKNHSEVCKKEDKDGVKSEAEEGPSEAKKVKPSLIFVDEEEENVVPREKLELLGKSEDLKRILSNPHLRSFLSHINTTHNPRGFMRLAMHEPIFVEFADICLKTIHPEISQENKEISIEQVQVRNCHRYSIKVHAFLV